MAAVRSFVFVVWMYGLMAVMGLIWLPALLLPRAVTRIGIRWYAALVRWGLRWICGVRTDLRGLEHVPEGGAIMASKHQCMWDVFAPFLTRADPAIILKRELLWYPVLGWYALKMAMIPIDRGGLAKAVKGMVRSAAARAQAGRQVLIFPEGTRTAPGAPPDYKAAGASALYKALDAPIVPVATNSGLCWPRKGLVRTPGLIVYEFLAPIEPGLDRKAMMAQLEGAIEGASASLLAEGLAVQGRRATAQRRNAMETR